MIELGKSKLMVLVDKDLSTLIPQNLTNAVLVLDGVV